MNRESLERRLVRLEQALCKERERLTRVSNNIPWGTGMKRTKCTPSLRQENEIKEKIKEFKAALAELN